MIKSFGDKHTEILWTKKTVLKWKNIQNVALRKLDQLDKAKNLLGLTFPPHNRLEALWGKWKGYYSIRINTISNSFHLRKRTCLQSRDCRLSLKLSYYD